MVLAVPSPANGVSGVDITAAFWNAQVRDAVTFAINPPILRVHQTTTTTSLPNATNTAITWDTNDVDSYSGHSTVTNPSRYVAQVAGWYQISASIAITATSSGSGAWGYIAKNGTQVSPTAPGRLNPSTFQVITVATDQIFLNTGDYIEVYANQNDGSAKATAISGGQFSMMSIRWVHA